MAEQNNVLCDMHGKSVTYYTLNRDGECGACRAEDITLFNLINTSN